jgi:hypothetical protein
MLPMAGIQDERNYNTFCTQIFNKRKNADVEKTLKK